MVRSRTKQPLQEAFGAALRELHARYEQRRGRSYSHEAIARLVLADHAAKSGPPLSLAGVTLWRLEQGQVTNPNVLVLRALSAFYGVPELTLQRILEVNRARPDLVSLDGPRLLEDTANALAVNAQAGGQHTEPDTDSGNFIAACVYAATRLITTSEELAELAQTLLLAATGGQASGVSEHAAQRHTGHRKTRRKPARGNGA